MRLGLAGLALATGCSGASSTVPAPRGGSPAGAVTGTAAFSILVPGAASASTTGRGVRYVSPNTQSVTIALQSSGGAAAAGPAVTFATTAGAPGCTAGASGLLCSATLTVPAGADVFTVTAFAQPGAGGAALAGGTASATIAAGSSSAIPLSLGGIVNSISLSLGGSLVRGVAATVPLVVTAKDATGATIVGSDAYSVPITLALTDPSGVTQLSATTVPSPGATITLAYNGCPAASAITVAASAPGVAGNGASSLSIALVTRAARYSSLVIFGDSLSDMGNLANVVQRSYGVVYPGSNFNDADGRFTDGPNTVPAARRCTGIWIEQFAATLASNPGVKDSLDGGTDYAFAAATTADGMTTARDGSGTIAVPVENIGQQVTDYLALHPTITGSTLFVVWAGTDELLGAPSPTAASATAAAAREVAVVQRLIDAGATDLLVANVPPLGAVPSVSGSADAGARAQAASSFNQSLASGLAGLPGANAPKTLRIVALDVAALFTATIAAPGGAGFANVTSPAQGNAGVDPDSYLFWDGVHTTTAGEHLIAASAASAIASP